MGPLGAVSLGVTVIGAVLGYVFVMLGITLYLDLNDIPLTSVESLVVIGTGIACIAVAYGGWRGFLTFA